MQSSEREPKEFPENVPFDEDVEVDLTRAEIIAVDRPFEEIFCSRCSFPMKTAVTLRPCGHSVCMPCFTDCDEYCQFCGFEVVDSDVIKDNL